MVPAFLIKDHPLDDHYDDNIYTLRGETSDYCIDCRRNVRPTAARMLLSSCSASSIRKAPSIHPKRIRNQMNQARWFWFAIGYQTLLAYVVSFCIYQIGTMVTTGAYGIGTIAYEIVKAHHGIISVANREGGGTIFTAQLPR